MSEDGRNPARRHRILVVDDDPGTVRAVRDWFEGPEYEILEAENGETGIRMATLQDPDIILLDLRMPGVDGIAVAERLKSDPVTRSIPVIVLTACRELNAKVEAFRAGADDFVTKPFDFEEVDARIRGMLRKRDMLVKLESSVRDLTATNEHLEQVLMVDEKTGLYNFRAFQRRLKEEWERSIRYAVPLSLVLFDLDHFKQVNDTMGHQFGDEVLKQFAMLVSGGARANDIAARYGGEEFAVVLPHTGPPMAMRVAERIRRAVEEFVFAEDKTPTRISVSASTCPTIYSNSPALTPWR